MCIDWINGHSELNTMPKGSWVNWIEEEKRQKFIELLYEMKAKGKDISYRKIREQIQSYGFPTRTDQSMKNHYDLWGRKIRLLQHILGTTSVGYDPQTQLPVVDDKRWAEIVQVSMFIFFKHLRLIIGNFICMQCS